MTIKQVNVSFDENSGKWLLRMYEKESAEVEWIDLKAVLFDTKEQAEYAGHHFMTDYEEYLPFDADDLDTGC